MALIQPIDLWGNIGSGKSTLTKSIAKKFPDSIFTIEPVEEWRRAGILDIFYKNMGKVSTLMQCYVFSSRIRHLKETMEKKMLLPTDFTPDCPKIEKDYAYVFADGHVISDSEVFKEVLREDGLISDIENVFYEETFKNWESILPPHKDFIYVYLKTSPEVCFERKKKRNRAEESTVSLEYLTKLNNKFDDLYAKMVREGYFVIEVDGNQSEELVLKEAEEKIRHAVRHKDRSIALYKCTVCENTVDREDRDIQMYEDTVCHAPCVRIDRASKKK